MEVEQAIIDGVTYLVFPARTEYDPLSKSNWRISEKVRQSVKKMKMMKPKEIMKGRELILKDNFSLYS